jgi:uncharacterized protein YdhG (YjbR/CyaY superfamily)
MTQPNGVDEYLAALPDDRRAAMQQIREAIRAAAPDAVEAISYKMPAFKTPSGKFFVSYDAFKKHYSLFAYSQAVIDGIGEPLTRHLAGRGTIRFSAAEPIPSAMITEIARIRFAEITGRPAR